MLSRLAPISLVSCGGFTVQHTSFPLMRTLAVLFCIAAAVVVAPLWAPLLLGAWFADLLQPAVATLERVLGGRRRGAAAVVVLVALAVLLPLVGLVAVLVSEARLLFEQVRGALDTRGSLANALLGGASPAEPHGWIDLLRQHGTNAWRAGSAIARASASAAIAVLVYIAALYTFAVDGARAYAWFETRLPLPRSALARLSQAFRETGRGLIVAGGGTALVQGAIATLAYVAIGLPRALLFGPLTAVCAIVPFVGTGLVWVPLTIELTATRQYGRAAVVLVVGVGIHALIDNFVRPVLARHGRLRLPTFVLLVAMLGGVGVFGAAGALLGPLLVRLGLEALEILADESGEPGRRH
jgi:predicted PurR-regulated permease PerM